MEESPEFQFDNYRITDVMMDFQQVIKTKISIDLRPTGTFNKETSEFELALELRIFDAGKEDKVIFYVNCLGFFSINNSKETIPEFFYQNSIPIIFPYLRAFVTTLTSQANVQPLVLKTYNLMALADALKTRTTFV